MDKENLKNVAAMTSLNHMMRRGYLDITAIDKVAGLMNIQVKGTETYQILSAMHCVNFSEMPHEMRDAIPELIKELLQMDAAYQFQMPPRAGSITVVHVDPENKPGGFLRRIGLAS